jgi:hypothetical protein
VTDFSDRTQLVLDSLKTADVRRNRSKHSESEVYVAATKFSPPHEVMASRSEAECNRAGEYAFEEFVRNEALPRTRPQK